MRRIGGCAVLLLTACATSPAPAPEPAVEAPPNLAAIADTDGDGVPDQEDLCPESAGRSATHRGCPSDDSDSDGDGLPDAKDACPEEAGPIEHTGCAEFEDDDGDGFDDRLDLRVAERVRDRAAELKAAFTDSDGDGVTDDEDACPHAPGPATGRGCPVKGATPAPPPAPAPPPPATVAAPPRPRAPRSDAQPVAWMTEMTEIVDDLNRSASAARSCEALTKAMLQWSDRHFDVKLANQLDTQDWENASRTYQLMVKGYDWSIAKSERTPRIEAALARHTAALKRYEALPILARCEKDEGLNRAVRDSPTFSAVLGAVPERFEPWFRTPQQEAYLQAFEDLARLTDSLGAILDRNPDCDPLGEELSRWALARAEGVEELEKRLDADVDFDTSYTDVMPKAMTETLRPLMPRIERSLRRALGLFDFGGKGVDWFNNRGMKCEAGRKEVRDLDHVVSVIGTFDPDDFSFEEQ